MPYMYIFQLLYPSQLMKRKILLSQAEYRLNERQKRIQASDMKIRGIDHLSISLGRSIKILWIPNNQISSLVNITQFVHLQELNIQVNKIKNGQQLLQLRQLMKFHRLWIIGNPFLEQPLEQDVLDLIIEKETDIEILSGDAIKQMKQLHQGQIKRIFLENYLKKEGFHRQIAQKNGRGRSYSNDELIINKIIPQLYTTIEDPRIVCQLKKQALEIKRSSQKSFEEALEQKKQNQKREVDNLISDLIMLNEQKQESAKQSLSYFSSPKSRETPKQVQKNIVSQRKYFRSKDKHEHQTNQKYKNQPSNFYSFSYLQKPTFNQFHHQPSSIQSQTQQIQNHLRQSDINLGSTLSKREIMSNSKLIIYENQENQGYVQSPYSYEQYETIYYRSLPKYDPAFTMLFSDYESLSDQQKNILIEALQKDHRSKTIKLYKIEQKMIMLKNDHETKMINMNQKIGQISQRVREMGMVSELKQETITNLQKQNYRLVEVVKGLADDYQQVNEDSLNFQVVIQERDKEINKLKQQLARSQQGHQQLKTSEDKADIIRDKYEKRIKKEKFIQTLKKIRLHHKIKLFRSKQQNYRKFDLLMLSWNMLKRNQSQSAYMKLKQQEKNEVTQYNAFQQWKLITHKSHQLANKQTQLLRYLSNRSICRLIKFCRKGYAEQKQTALKNYWADQHLSRVTMAKFIRICKKMKESEQQKAQKGDQHLQQKLKSKYLKCLKNNLSLYDGIITQLCSKIRKDKLKDNLWRLSINKTKQREKRILGYGHSQISQLCERKLKQMQKKHSVNFMLKKWIKEIPKSKRLILSMKARRLRQLVLHYREISHTTIDLQEKTSHCEHRLQRLKAHIFFNKLTQKKRLKSNKSKKTKILLINLTQKLRVKVMMVNKTQFDYEKYLDQKRIRQCLYNMLRHSYLRKLKESERQKQNQLIYTENIISKMKSISVTEMQNVKQEYQEYQQQLEMKILENEANYRKSWMEMQDKYGTLLDNYKLLQNQQISAHEKQEIYLKERQLILEQLKLKTQENEQSYGKNQRLKGQIADLEEKYDRVLSLYTQTTFELERKQRETLDKLEISRIEISRQKRDKTIQKSKPKLHQY